MGLERYMCVQVVQTFGVLICETPFGLVKDFPIVAEICVTQSAERENELIDVEVVVVPGIPGLRAVPDLVTIHPILPPTVHIHPYHD
jgi:hypothetical protein